MHKEIIGNATLFLGDCIDVLSTLEKADACITDPQYGIGENSHRVASRGKLAKTTDYGSFDWDKEPASADRIAACIAAAKTTIIFGGNYFQLPPARCWLVWDKMNSGDFADCELAWTNIKGSVRIFRHMWNGMIRDGEERGQKRVHPTQKPVALMRWCIDKAGNPQSIIDPFMGSGTTGAAAVGMGRKFIGIEKDERYFEIACSRIEDAQRQQSLIDPRDDYERCSMVSERLSF